VAIDANVEHPALQVLTPDIASALSRPMKSQPFWPARTPRWLLRCIDACKADIAVEGGVCVINRVADGSFSVVAREAPSLELQTAGLRAAYASKVGTALPRSLAKYDSIEIPLETVQSIVSAQTLVPALFSDTHDQLLWQLRTAAEFMYEMQENLAFNHPAHGLRNNVAESMDFEVGGPPTPDVLDDLLSLAWKRPDCFLMHPLALAEFHKAATARSLNLESVEAFGASFTSWRGLPICPTDKLQLVVEGEAVQRSMSADQLGEAGWLPRTRAPSPATSPQSSSSQPTVASARSLGFDAGTAATDVLLARIGVENQGVVCLHAAGTQSHADLPGISVDFMGRSADGVESYQLSMYCALAVLSPGALARAQVTI
jgi:hypothetical protein